MARLIQYVNEADPQRVLLLGGPKTGKTALASVLAARFKVLMLDLENGKSVMLNHCTPEQLSNIEYVKIPDTYNNPCAVKTLLSLFVDNANKVNYICNQHGSLNCPLCRAKKDDPDACVTVDLREWTADKDAVILIDSATQFAISALHNLCNVNGIKRENATTDDKVSYTLWDGQGATLDKLFSTLQNGPWHICCTAHEMEVEMPDKTKKLVAAVGTRKYAANFGKYFDSVIRVAKRNKKHVIESLTSSSLNADTGGRRSIDLAKAGNSLIDYFVPASEVRDKMEKLDISKVPSQLPKTPKPVTQGASTPGASTVTTPAPAGNPLAAFMGKKS